MTQLFQDAMAICRHFHKPDLFLTMTANPKWSEIIHSLFSGQTATDHPDIVSQVFEQKKKALLKLIDNSFFGTTVTHIHTIEFQKRGLLHIHLLIFLHPQYHIRDSHHINSMISAQLPDSQLQLLLYAKVTKYMLHGPNEHYVNFHAHQTVNEVLARQNVEKTQLTAWFDYNSAHDDGLGLTYQQFPQHYTWNAKVKTWYPR